MSESIPSNIPTHSLIAQYSHSHLQSIKFEQSLQNIISEYKLIRVDTPAPTDPLESEKKLEEYRDQFTFYSNQMLTSKEQRQQDLLEQNNSKFIAANQFVQRIIDKHQHYLLKKKAFFNTFHKFQEVIEEMKKTNRRRENIDDQILKKEELVVDMIQTLSNRQITQAEKVKTFEEEIKELQRVYDEQCCQNVKIKSQLAYMKQYISQQPRIDLFQQIQSLNVCLNPKTTNQEIDMLDNKLRVIKSSIILIQDGFNVSINMHKLQQQFNNMNSANRQLQEQNIHLTSLITELNTSSSLQGNPIHNIPIVEYYLTNNTDKMNSQAYVIRQRLSTLDYSLSSFVNLLSSLSSSDKTNANEIGEEIRKVIESNISKNSLLNKLNSEIASLNKKLYKINNSSNKLKIKEKKMMIRRKNDDLRQLDMEKDAKISQLQMLIENEKHKKMMRQMATNKQLDQKNNNESHIIEIGSKVFASQKNEKRYSSSQSFQNKNVKKNRTRNKKKNNQ